MKKIDLNCDLGEGMPWDEAIMPHISSANIACGYHAGDEATIRKTIDLCSRYHVAIGAHPGFNDKPGFGRKEQQLNDKDLYKLITDQLVLFKKICDEKQAKLHHVKLHGALYNMAARNRLISNVVVQAIKDFHAGLLFYGLSGSIMIETARAAGLQAVEEVFADRAYQTDGTLVPRGTPGAVLHAPDKAWRQVRELIEKGAVTALNGDVLTLRAETICIHGDEAHAPQMALYIHQQLQDMGYTVTAP